MSAFDISIMVFFVTVIYYVFAESYDYWYGKDGVLATNAAKASIKPAVAPKHIPAPSRPSPAAPNFRTAPASYNVRPMPVAANVRPTPAAARVTRPIKKQPARVA